MRNKMNPSITAARICGIVAIFLSTTTYSEEQRNYWQESMALDSVEEIVAYIDPLSLEEFKLLGRQAGEEFQRKSQDLPSKKREQMWEKYFWRLAIYTGAFEHQTESSEKVYQLFVSFGDPDATLIERWVLALGSSRSDPEVFRRDNYNLIVILEGIMKSPDEDTLLRAAACRQVGHSLFHEYRNPTIKPLSDKEKESLSTRIAENIKLCRRIVADADTPSKLREAAETSLRLYKRAGLIDEQQPESEQAPAGDVLKAAPEE